MNSLFSKLSKLLILIFLVYACSDDEFNSFSDRQKKQETSSDDGNKAVGDDNNPSSAVGDDNNPNNSINEGADNGSIAQKGKSLDLYFIIDISGSLGQSGPLGVSVGNDPNCLRYDGLIKFKNNLTNHLGKDGDVRATFVLFSSEAEVLATIDDFLAYENTNFENTYKDSICKTGGQTNPSDAFKLTTNTYKKLDAITTKDMASVLFFTDGQPNRGLSKLDQRIAEMKENFGDKIFSVFLFAENFFADFLGTTTLPLDFLNSISGSEERVKKANKAEELGDVISEFIK